MCLNTGETSGGTVGHDTRHATEIIETMADFKRLVAEIVASKGSAQSKAGRVSGVRRSWGLYLVRRLTDFVFDGLPKSSLSRPFVAAWQREVFGVSVSSFALRSYADPSRGGGDRRTPAEIPFLRRQYAYIAYRECEPLLSSGVVPGPDFFAQCAGGASSDTVTPEERAEWQAFVLALSAGSRSETLTRERP